ncbi:YihY/virulence factor BrkB family protein [Natronosalvus vescus]|uniref:YihY/virulence factor BrkB family protein n=1 Tax=Natronosalvus vescus TaxID=2953881 RepID=UPI002090DEB7|nr:YihY/virulence factor BrkB family protein [Natronosalvus vescus]
MIDRQQAIQATYRVVTLARTQQLTLLAAAVAFYAFLSLVPLALLALGIAATLGGEQLASQVAGAASDVLTPAAQEILTETLVDEPGRQGATVVGAFGVLWGASRVLRGLDQVFASVYGTIETRTFLDTLWNSTIVLLTVGIGLAFVAALEFAIRFVPGLTVGLGSVFVLVGLFAAFLPIYVVYPAVDIRVRDALPGALIAAVGWFTLTRAFSLYTTVAGDYVVYGALGAVLLVLIWLYIGAAILVFGVVVNAVVGGVDVDRQLQSLGPRQMSTEAMSEDEPGADGWDDETHASPEPSARTRDRADDPAALREELRQLEDRLEDFESSVDSRTVDRQSLERDLKRYVRRRARRGHAHGWGPYLVLLYGTAMTIAAFYFLSGIWAILAMFVVWTSTLGVYALMVLFGTGISLLGIPGRLRDRASEWRS